MDKNTTDLGPAFRGIDAATVSRRLMRYLAAEGLTAAEKLLVVYLMTYRKVGDSQWPFPSYATIGADLGMDGKNVGKLVRELARPERGCFNLSSSGHGGGKPIAGSKLLTTPTNCINFQPLMDKLNARALQDPEHRALVEVEGLNRLRALVPDFARAVAHATDYRRELHYDAVNAWAVQLMLDGDSASNYDFDGNTDPATWDMENVSCAFDAIVCWFTEQFDEEDVEAAMWEDERRYFAEARKKTDAARLPLLVAGYMAECEMGLPAVEDIYDNANWRWRWWFEDNACDLDVMIAAVAADCAKDLAKRAEAAAAVVPNDVVDDNPIPVVACG